MSSIDKQDKSIQTDISGLSGVVESLLESGELTELSGQSNLVCTAVQTDPFVPEYENLELSRKGSSNENASHALVSCSGPTSRRGSIFLREVETNLKSKKRSKLQSYPRK